MEMIALAAAVIALVVAVVALRRPEPAVPTEGILETNLGGCNKDNHQWSDRPYLISGNEKVYYCRKGCGSTLRHRVK